MVVDRIAGHAMLFDPLEIGARANPPRELQSVRHAVFPDAVRR